MPPPAPGTTFDELVDEALVYPDKVVAVVGPTASGKTALAIALAQRLGGEIINVDSVQIYRRFDLGSGKPTAEELAQAPHHLVSERDPLDALDAAGFAALAEERLQDIRRRGRRPIVAGGTFLWVKAFLAGLAEAPRGNDELRAQYAAFAEERGRAALHERLHQVDPASAQRLHPNDFVRVSRALEVFDLTGRPLSAFHADHGFQTPRHDAMLVGIWHSPEALTMRIERRVEGWLRDGWVAEVRDLMDAGYGGARAMGSVGYKEVRDHLEGRLPVNELAPTIVRTTRVFARRQRTWLGHEKVRWLLPSEPGTEPATRAP